VFRSTRNECGGSDTEEHGKNGKDLPREGSRDFVPISRGAKGYDGPPETIEKITELIVYTPFDPYHDSCGSEEKAKKHIEWTYLRIDEKDKEFFQLFPSTL